MAMPEYEEDEDTMNKNIATYSEDGRSPIEELWKKYDKLVESGFFEKELIYTQTGKDMEGNEVEIPTYGYKSKLEGKALWILAGVHGEEAAGPNALANDIEVIIEMTKEGIPIVCAPLLNGIGYIKDHRYFNAKRDGGSSVTDSEHLLGTKNEPENFYAGKMGEWVQKTEKSHPPLLSVDHHEDEIQHDSSEIDAHVSYCYAYGQDLGIIDKLTVLLVEILKNSGFPVQEEGETRFGEKIIKGSVINSKDGSIDQLLMEKYGAYCFVIETTRDDSVPIPLVDRIKAQAAVIHLYRHLLETITEARF